MSTHGMDTRRAFTLVEMLVAIAVVVVMLSILVPALGAAYRGSQSARCLAQARDLGVAMAGFTASNGGRLPENRTLVGPEEHVTWRHRFVERGLMPEGESWRCPRHPGKPSGEEGSTDWGTRCVGDVPSSYAVNGHVLWRQEKREKDRRTDIAIRRPSHTILIAETQGTYPDLRVTAVSLSIDVNGGGFYSYWHGGDGTYGFFDGHAEIINLMATGNPDCRWHNGRDYQQDPFDPQESREIRPHDHPDWKYLINSVYLDGN